MKLMSPTDSMFLLTESREHPMHVGGLPLFEPPEDAGPEFVREITRRWRTAGTSSPPSANTQRPPSAGLPTSAGPLTATTTSTSTTTCVALLYRRRGRVRDLLELTSRLHGTLLDRHRPLWEPRTGRDHEVDPS